ncbi:hypothetical protein HBN50_09020 [Halobacteriovorax sp. GB3]|uniref:hypothetical protein n=1 Tax=Halobacteriovorax sp. GB3 TaxID=2719615 RepID=UPI00235DFBBA|nr:hypothetical protein [Halobacteriovorax sp. GB3]MDD0853238.1 hypothetical protein [Halobacteriovorax sp. GB3]
MKKIILSLTLLSTLSSLNAYSAEIDSYTHRDKLFVFDASHFIDELFNQKIEAAVKEMNEIELQCPTNEFEAEEAFDLIHEKLASPFIGHSIAQELEDTLPDRRKIYTSYEESIYSDTTLWQGISLKLKGILSTMKIKGNIVGVDKLGHFFVEGWGFYKRAYLEDLDQVYIDDAIDWGRFTEKTYFGMTTTGIFSHSDLIANFNGMRFWNRIFSFKEDVLAKKKLPAYLSCKDSNWKMAKRFTIKEYVDPAWDEGINCNLYDSETIEDHVTSKIKKSFWIKDFFFDNFDFCPVNLRECKSETEKYGKWAQGLFHPICLE